jgi:hypothetical protein
LKILWHIFVVSHDGSEVYRGSRCSESEANAFCIELMTGLIDTQDWKNASHRQDAGLSSLSTSGSYMGELTDEQRIAFHEAGHAVAAIQLGVDLSDYGQTTIVPKEYANGSFSMGESYETLSEVERDLIINCAGYGSLRSLGYPEEFSSVGCGDDFSKAQDLIESWALQSLDHWKIEATHLLSLPPNAMAVKSVAEELLKHKTIGPEYTTILVLTSTGNMSQLDCEQFKANYGAAGLSYWSQ